MVYLFGTQKIKYFTEFVTKLTSFNKHIVQNILKIFKLIFNRYIRGTSPKNILVQISQLWILISLYTEIFQNILKRNKSNIQIVIKINVDEKTAAIF